MKTASENVIRALARAMVAARAGDTLAVAIVAVGDDGKPDASFGGEAELMPSVNIGLDMMKQQLLHQVMLAAAQPVSPLVRPAAGEKLQG